MNERILNSSGTSEVAETLRSNCEALSPKRELLARTRSRGSSFELGFDLLARESRDVRASLK